MARFLVYGLILATALYAYKVYKRESQRVVQRLERIRAEKRNGAKGTLVQDPVTGEYRVERD